MMKCWTEHEGAKQASESNSRSLPSLPLKRDKGTGQTCPSMPRHVVREGKSDSDLRFWTSGPREQSSFASSPPSSSSSQPACPLLHQHQRRDQERVRVELRESGCRRAKPQQQQERVRSRRPRLRFCRWASCLLQRVSVCACVLIAPNSSHHRH